MQKPMERLLTMVQYGIENGERRKCTANDSTGLGCANARCLKDNDRAESGYSLPLHSSPARKETRRVHLAVPLDACKCSREKDTVGCEVIIFP